MKLELEAYPESNYRLFARSLKLYFVSFLRVFPLAFLLAMIVYIPQLFAFLYTDKTLGFWTMGNVVQIFLNIFALFVFLSMLWRIWSVFYQRNESFLDDFKVARKKILIVLVSAIIQTLIISTIAYFAFSVVQMIWEAELFKKHFYLAFYLFVCTGIISLGLIIYLYLLFFFYIPLILTENNGILYSLKHSAILVFKNAWRVLLLQITPWFIYVFILMGMRYFLNVEVQIYGLEAMHNVPFFVTVLKILLFAIYIPWIGALLLVQLRDLELRKQLQP